MAKRTTFSTKRDENWSELKDFLYAKNMSKLRYADE